MLNILTRQELAGIKSLSEMLTCAALQGPACQNRAIEGDVVALRILQPEQWVHMKGFGLPRSADFAAAVTARTAPRSMCASACPCLHNPLALRVF